MGGFIMKTVSFTLIAILLLITCFGCSDQKTDNKQLSVKEKIQRAVDKGNVVVVQKSDDFSELGNGKEDLKNFSKVTQFINDFKSKKKSELTISYFRGSESVTSHLDFDGKEIKYENNNPQYIAKTGTYTCGYLEVRGVTLLIESCKGNTKKSPDFSSAPVLFGKELGDLKQ